MRKKLHSLRLIVQERITTLVVHDNLKEASLLLLDLTEVIDASRSIEALIIARGVNKLQKEQSIGILEYETARVESNRLAFQIIKLLEDICLY